MSPFTDHPVVLALAKKLPPALPEGHVLCARCKGLGLALSKKSDGCSFVSFCGECAARGSYLPCPFCGGGCTGQRHGDCAESEAARHAQENAALDVRIAQRWKAGDTERLEHHRRLLRLEKKIDQIAARAADQPDKLALLLERHEAILDGMLEMFS